MPAATHAIYVALIIVCLLISCDAASLQLVSVDGSCRSASQIGSYVSSQGISQTGNACSIAALIDCSSSSDGGAIFNTLAETSFDSSSKGLCLEMSDTGAFLYASFDSMFSAQFCGSKAADFCGLVSSNVFVLLSARDLTETLQGHDQIFRRMMTKLKLAVSPLQSITFVIKAEAGESGNWESEIQDRLSEIWGDVSGDGQVLSDRVAIGVVTVDLADQTSVQSARIALLAACRADKGAKAPSTLGATLFAAWGGIPSGYPRAILTPMQRQSLIKVEAAYTAGVAQIENAVGHWQARIGDGKIVGKFGDRVQQLLVSVRNAYNIRTVGSLTVRDRADRGRQLEEYLATAVSELFSQQLGNLQAKTVTQFRKSLLNLAASAAGLQQEETQQALRRALFDLRAATSDLEVDSLDLSSADLQATVSGILQVIVGEFPETAAARLEEVRKVEKSTKLSSTKADKIVSMGLNLVGMLRPPGFGNVQGVIGYATSLLGLPLDLLLGVQNDGDSPEVMGEDREYPILRLQPKVHFDIDVPR